jgi:CRP-like cAMP-binding protein
VVAALTAGSVFGEMAFLLEQPRLLDVDAATDPTEVLSLSERQLRRLVDVAPRAGAILLANIARMLCRRLVAAG